MEYKARPTTYAGVNFRSRLEARWAAFFDLCGWQWSYEPVDFEQWVPDFLVHMPLAEVYVEVKPVMGTGGWGAPEDSSYQKAYAHQPYRQVLLLGYMPERHCVGALLDPPAGADYAWLALHESLRVNDWEDFWREAGNRTQWRAR